VRFRTGPAATLSLVVPEHVLAGSVPASRPHRRIQASSGFIPIDFGELWRYRGLLYRFLWRDFKARYKQTYLGPFWAVFRPFVTIVLFSVIFGHLAHISTGSKDIPYPLFALGLLPWSYFSSVFTGSASSMLNSTGLLQKVYFPRIYAPLSAGVTPLVDLALTMLVAVVLFAYYRLLPSWHIVFMPFFILLALVAGLGFGLWFTGIMVRYRDAGYAMPFMLQVGMYVTPVVYPSTFIPERWRWLLALNPLTAVIEGFRWSLLGSKPPSVPGLVASAGIGVILMVAGLYFFRRTERTIVDMA
jgi:lipopolysaccharide transport system permease protein